MYTYINDSWIISSVIYLPVLCVAEIVIEGLSQFVEQSWVLHSALGESVPHDPHPPRLSIQALCDAIVWVSAGIPAICLTESSLHLRRTDAQAHAFSLPAVLLSDRGAHLQQRVLHVPQHPPQRDTHHTYTGETTQIRQIHV